MLIKLIKLTFFKKQFNQKSIKIKIMINVIVYSINKFIEFNDIITHKLMIINKHIYEIFD